MNDFDDQLSRSLSGRADAAGTAAPDVFDVRRRVGHQRNLRRAVAGACALVLVAGAGAAIALSANRTNAPAAADGGATTVPAPAPTSTVPAAPIACGADQLTTAGTETLIHLGQPFTPAAGQCLVGTARNLASPVVTSGTGCVVTFNTATGEPVPTTTPVSAPEGCTTIVDCPNSQPIPPPATTILGGGGSLPVIVGSFCAAGGEGPGGPITVEVGPTSTVPSTCADGEVTVQPGDVVLAGTGLFEPNVGQCVVATPQVGGMIVTCTIEPGASGAGPAGTIVVSSGSLEVLTPSAGVPAPPTGFVTSIDDGCPGATLVGGPATTVEVPAPTTTVKS